jgi:IS1 family transposase
LPEQAYIMVIMNRLSVAKRVQIVSALVEGNAINATARMVGVSKVTILKFLGDLGRACAEFHDKTVRNLACKEIQCDEIHSFCYAREKNVPEELRGKFGFGDVWTWTAICADSKLLVSWKLGTRGASTAYSLMNDLASRLRNRIQLTTDGHRVYLQAVESTFGADIDYAMLVKLYGNDFDEAATYSAAECIGCRQIAIIGNPDPRKISTSYVERHNLTMRMSMRRFTRLTNAHSKKVENHGHALALHCVFYNFARVNQAIRVTPAMEAGIADHVWSIEEIIKLLDRSVNMAA